MFTYATNWLDGFANTQCYASKVFPPYNTAKLPCMDLFTYCNDLHQLNMRVFGKVMQAQFENFLPIPTSSGNWFSNNFLNEACCDFALRYHSEQLKQYVTNILKMDWPLNILPNHYKF